MTRITSKGIDTVNVGNHPRFNMLPNPEIGRRGGYKCRTLEMHFQLRDQQLKTIIARERRLSQNFRVTTGQKPTIDTHTNKSNQLKYNAKGSHQSTKERTREEGKKKEQQQQIKNR